MPSAQAHYSRFVPIVRTFPTASPAPEALAQVCRALIFLMVSLGASIGASHTHSFLALPGYPVVAIELLVICLAIALCALISCVLAAVHAVRLAFSHG